MAEEEIEERETAKQEDIQLADLDGESDEGFFQDCLKIWEKFKKKEKGWLSELKERKTEMKIGAIFASVLKEVVEFIEKVAGKFVLKGADKKQVAIWLIGQVCGHVELPKDLDQQINYMLSDHADPIIDMVVETSKGAVKINLDRFRKKTRKWLFSCGCKNE